MRSFPPDARAHTHARLLPFAPAPLPHTRPAHSIATKKGKRSGDYDDSSDSREASSDEDYDVGRCAGRQPRPAHFACELLPPRCPTHAFCPIPR